MQDASINSFPGADCPLRISEWPAQVVGWIGLVFFAWLTLLLLVNDGGWAALVCLIFAALSLFLIVGYGSTEMDGEKVMHINWLGRYQIPWSEIRCVECDAGGNNIVFRGDNKQVVVPGRAFWVGKDKKAMAAFYMDQVRQRRIPLKQSFWATFKFSQGTKVA